MKESKIVIFILLFLGCTFAGNSQSVISGFIKDQASGEALIGATIYNPNTLHGSVSDQNGYFTLSVQTPVQLKVSYVGYHAKTITINQAKYSLMNIRLKPALQMDEITIKGEKPHLSSIITLSNKELIAIPSLGGKPDVMKSLQLLPGIASQSEGSSRLLVRGGDPGQNLYLFDGVPVIYVNHLGGFLSVFNPDIINTIDIYKGGFPSKYGGRLSSIIDITQREGNVQAYQGALSIGITDASFSLEGPGGLKNSSFIVTGRKTLIDALMAGFTAISEGNDFVGYYGFYDLNGKYSWKPNDRNSLHLNIYHGDDYFNFHTYQKTKDKTEKSLYSSTWGNLLSSLQWKSVLSPKVFMTNSFSFTRYRLRHLVDFKRKDSISTETFVRNYVSTVSDLSMRSNFKVHVSKGWTVNFGLQNTIQKYMPSRTEQSNIIDLPETEYIRIFESALYGENLLEFGNRLKANLGLRVQRFQNLEFNNLSWEPRINMDIRIFDDQHLVFNYMKVTQNTHLLVTQGSLFSNEVWVPSDATIAPAQNSQFSLSWVGSFKKDLFRTEITAYTKSMTFLSTYKEGYSNLIGDGDWRSKIVSDGKGQSKGIEFMMRKTRGAWTGFMSYAYSQTTRQYPKINMGREFIFDYNRPHTFSISINKQFNPSWKANLTWVYQSGLPYTPVTGRQYTLNPDRFSNGYPDYYETLLYGERNSATMLDYHRLDVGFSYETTTKRNRKAIWTFSVYNLYNRKNPNYYYYDTGFKKNRIDNPKNWNTFKPTNLYQMSFFPIIPSVSYKIFLIDLD